MPKEISLGSTSGKDKQSWDQAIESMNSWYGNVTEKTGNPDLKTLPGAGNILTCTQRHRL